MNLEGEKLIMAKKKSVGFKIFVTVLKSFCVVILMMLVAVASYNFTMKYYEVYADEEKGKDVIDIVVDVTADEVSRNIIYSVDAETSRVEAVVIEVLNTLTGNLDYITIPDNYQMVINNDVYQRLYAAGVDVPQVMRISQLNKYITDDTSYEYGIILFEESLGIDIGYYTAMPSDMFNSVFTMDSSTGCYKLTETAIAEAASVADVNAMEKFIKDKYEGYTTNIKIKSKIKYAECYKNVNPELIYYHVIPGEENEGAFTADAKEAKTLYSQILEDPAHEVAQTQVKNISSKGKNIKVLNGSGGDGIAAKVKGILEKDGYEVVKIADNPELIDNTVIRVSEEGMGKDIKTYFDGATIEVAKLEKGIDIIVIVGKADAQISAE